MKLIKITKMKMFYTNKNHAQIVNSDSFFFFLYKNIIISENNYVDLGNYNNKFVSTIQER